MSIITWSIIILIVISFGYLSTRMARRAGEDDFSDTGLALLDFGRAYPNEAVRSLHATIDGQAIFVRLHDNRAGFMRVLGNRYACLLIEPGSVRVTLLPEGNGFAVEFRDAPTHNGQFRFARPEEAAEVSLWLLGNYVNPEDLIRPEEHANAR